MKRRSTILIAAAAVLTMAVMPASAASLATKALKGAAIGYAVNQSAGTLNKFINTITLNNGVSHKMDTKVVPILSVGDKGYVGGAQVAGPASLVKEVKAVFQYEQNIDRGRYRIKVLVPSSSINPLQLKRVEKVGVTAIIDVSLAGGLKKEYYSAKVGAGDAIRAGAIAVGVKAAAGPINSAINAVTINKGVSTAVVPMASVGEKAYVGGVQISGSANTVKSVQVAWIYEDLFSSGKFRVKVIVPSNSINPLKIKRVDGVGITAIIDTSIADQQEYNYDKKRASNTYKPKDNRYYNDKDRHDNGKHKGWYIGEHKGWDKQKDKDKDKNKNKKKK
ncbi:MAG TPA: hypothetical protein PLU88_08775 [Armatimonadota bacterium]|nr:hypothetical protein [Armatimonadota bacterium]